MARNYTVVVPDYIDGEICSSEQPIERPITEEDEETLQIGQVILAAIDEPNFSFPCKVLDISDTHVRLGIMIM
jgi:hypothetical protein